MLGLLRLVFIGFLVLTFFYVTISIWSRAVRRRKLKAAWDEAQGPGDRSTFVREGMEDYEASLRPKLVLLVYIIPVVLVATIVYLTNFQ